ncbi:RHS repeat-associated core domain-containing protein [bacterium]|nr:RHS repeat-associated core domain-containing protein [bacterium]
MMTKWQKTGETTVEYGYDGYGMRVRKTPSGGTPTDYLLDVSEVVEEISTTNVTSYARPWLPIKISGTAYMVFYADCLGSTRIIANANSIVQMAAAYDAFGNPINGIAESFGFAGQYRYSLDSINIYYLKARYYNPEVGRFTSRDPLGYRGGINLYEYAGNNPVMRIDPTGLVKWWVPFVPAWIMTLIDSPCFANAIGTGQGWRDGHNNNMAHCTLTCELARCPGLSYGDSQILEGLFEELQWLFGPFNNPWWDAAAFYDAVGDGLGSYGDPCKSCTDLCQQAWGDGMLDYTPAN